MAALVFVYSIIGVVAPSYEVDWKRWKMDPVGDQKEEFLIDRTLAAL
jgi:hypothetical protein